MVKKPPKIGVMFFSATGESQRIARKIAGFFKDSAVLMDITHGLKQPNIINEGGLDFDILFVVVPVYSQLCPAPIAKFLKNLQYSGAVVPCVTFGRVSAGRALTQVGQIFLKKGAVILAGAEFAGSHFYYAPHSLGKDSLVREELACKENYAVSELCSNSLFRFDKGIALQNIPVTHFNPLSLVFPKLRAQIGVRIKRLDKSKCAGCKNCQTTCPFNAINKNNKLTAACQRCGHCAKNCPQSNKQLVLRLPTRKYLEKHLTPNHPTKVY